jgi:hypothetical protein
MRLPAALSSSTRPPTTFPDAITVGLFFQALVFAAIAAANLERQPSGPSEAAPQCPAHFREHVARRPRRANPTVRKERGYRNVSACGRFEGTR